MNRIALLRKQQKMTQNDLARRLGITYQAVSGYETERREPSFDILHKMADVFGVSVDYLLGHDSPDAPTPDIVRVYDALTPRGQMLLMGYGEGLLAAEGKELSVVLTVPATARKMGQN